MKLIKKFVINGIVLTCSSIFMRFVSVVFNVYITEKIGSVGMGLFSLILSVYTFGVTFAVSGVSIASTRLVTQELVRNSSRGAAEAMKKCVLYALVFGVSAFVLLYFSAEEIAAHWLRDIRTLKSLKLLAVSLPFISLSSALGGYFCAVRRVIKNAVTNILEQFIRIFITVVLLTVHARDGIEAATVAIVVGMCVSEALAFIFSFILYVADVKRNMNGLDAPPSSNITMRMLKMSLPVAFSAYIRSALVTLEHILIPRGLVKSGVSGEEALSSYGVISGMVFPVVLFPIAFLSAFSGLVVPEMTKYKENGEVRHISYVVSRIFRLTLIFSIGAAGIFVFFADTLGILLYDSAEAGKYIKIFAALIPVMYLDNTTDAILKGLGEQVASMRYNIIDALVSVILVYFLLPPLGVGGYIAVVFVCELLNCALSFQRLMRVTVFPIELFRNIIAPLISIVAATCICRLLLRALRISYSFTLTGVIVSIAVCLVFYYCFLRVTFCVTNEDERWFAGIFKK